MPNANSTLLVSVNQVEYDSLLTIFDKLVTEKMLICINPTALI